MKNNDLISRKALVEHLRTILMSDVFPNWANMEQRVKCSVGILGERFKLEIEAAPAVDAERVRRGEWITIWEDCYVGKSKAKIGHTFCSVCNSWRADVEFNYCPNCGAKMDKEVTNHAEQRP